MKRNLLTRTGLLIFLFVTNVLAQNHFLVRAPSSAIYNIASRHGVTVVASLGGSASGLHVVNVPAGANASQILAGLMSDPQVERVEHDDPVTAPEVSAGPQLRPHQGKLPVVNGGSMVNYFGTYVWGAYVSQPAASIIGITAAHRFATGVGTVAFLDTGVDFGHPALAPYLVWGWDFTRNLPGGSDFMDLVAGGSPTLADQSTTPILDDDYIPSQSTTPILDDSIIVGQSTTPILDDDGITLGQSTTPILDGFKAPHDYGHGTMVAGLIHLVAPTARLMPVKVFTSNGVSTLSLIISGIYYAVDHGAKVINMSFNFGGTSQELTQAINYANAHRVILVASAGNNGQSVVVYPAGYQQVMGIASTSNQDVRSSFSNFGSVVTIAAPGEGIISTYPFNHYAAGWGTSFSAPLVSGAAALLAQLDYNINETQADNALSQADAVGQGLGAGRLDLVKACLAVHGFN